MTIAITFAQTFRLSALIRYFGDVLASFYDQIHERSPGGPRGKVPGWNISMQTICP